MTAEPRMIGGRYQMGDVLGRGGMAEVWRAIDTRLGRPVAVKMLRTDLATDPTFQARFRREAQSAAGLNHPTIVAVYDTGEDPDPITGVSIPYIVMELVDGPTLRDVLRDGRKILPERALELMQGVLDALGYSHKAGIVHRDIKPANVMLTPTGGVKVMDFGIARAVADTSATMTQTAAVIGTAQYLSPEQARGETVDSRSDLYSAGCLMYELLVGRPPFIGDSPVSVAYQHVREAPVPPSTFDPSISPDIDAITLKALAKDPADRYQTARDMKADIGRVLVGQQATAVVPRVNEAADTPTRVVAPPPVQTEEPEEERKNSRTGLIAALVVLGVVVLGLAAWGIYRYTTADRAPEVVMVEVPNVLTYTEQQANDQLTARNLKVMTKTTNGNADTKGTVTGQDPVSGTSVAEGTAVTITVNQGPKTGKIPSDLVGKDVDDAEDELNDAGFDNVTKKAAGSESVNAKANSVVSVSPGAGSTQPLDTGITLTYATGKSEVPNLTERLYDAAQSEAEAAGFKVTRKDQQTSDYAPNLVISQDPQAGSTATRGSTITLTVAVAPPSPPPTPPTTPPATPSSPTTTPTPGTGNS